MAILVFWLGYLWTLPNTVLGVLLAFLGGCRPVAFRHGALWFVAMKYSPWRWWAAQGFAAITFGGVVIMATETVLALPEMVRHEMRHFWQFRILGPFYLPVYLGHGVWLYLTGRHGYFDNFLEADANKQER
jgi:hypothetical protein